MRLAEFHALPTQHVDLGHTEVAVRRVGEGPPLVFIHGWPLTGATYRKLLPRLSSRFECILPDSPGLGDSTFSDTTDFRFRAQAETWRRFFDAIALQRFSLIAHDTGATVARLFAADNPDAVHRFVIFDTEIPDHRPPGATVGMAMLRMRALQRGFRRLLARRRFVESRFGFRYAFVDPSLFDDEFYAAYVDPLIESDARWEGAMRYVTAVDWSVVDELVETHRAITCPVKLIWGSRDTFFPIAGARQMMSQLPSCHGLVELPAAGLMSYEEQPDLAVDAMLEFLIPP